MLLSENRSRREHCDLFTLHDRLECRAKCDFGLAKADIAADQAVHRLRTLHVDLRIDDRFHLIRRFAKGKRMVEFRLPSCIRGKRVAGMRLPLRLDCEHFAGVIEDGSGGVSLGAHPFRVAQRAERWRFFSHTDIAGNEVRLLERDVEFRFIGELEHEDFLCFLLVGTNRRAVRDGVSRLASFDFARERLRQRATKLLQPQKARDAMFEMHDKIAFGEFAEIDLHTMTFGATQASPRMGSESSE